MTARRLIVEADGGSRGNPGVAGFGALVRDAASGQVLAERAEPLGKASNNVAEYAGLVVGLTEAEMIDDRAAVEVRMDSKLVVEQMSGRWKIKHDDMKRLAAQAREIARRIEKAGGVVVYRWIPRERNKAADKLSNDGMDGTSVTRRPWQRPDPSDPSEPSESPEAAEPGEPMSEPGSSAVAVSARADEPGDLDDRAELVEPAESARGRVRTGPATTPPGEPVRVVLVRHGVTEANRDGRLAGRGGADLDLDGEGQRQAHRLAAALHAFLGDRHLGDGPDPVRVVSSSLTRAHRTGQLVAARFGVSCARQPDWDEQDYGDLEGRTIADLAASDPDGLQRLRRDASARCPGGESHADLEERVVAAYEREVAAGGTVVVATHRMAILAVLGHVLGADLEHVWRLAIAPASMTSVRVWPDGAVSVEFVNDTSHLRD